MAGPFGSVASGALKYAIGGVAARAIYLVSTFIYLRYLTPADVGLQAIALLLELALLVIAGYAMTDALGNYYYARPRDDAERATIVGTVCTVVGVAGAAVLAAWLYFASSIAGSVMDGSPVSVSIVRLIGVSFFATLYWNIALRLWQLRRQIGIYNGSTAAKFVVSLGFSFVFLQEGLGVVGVILGWTISSVAVGVFSIWWLRRSYAWRWDSGLALRLGRLGWPFVPAMFLLLVIGSADRYVLRASSGFSAVGVYAVSMTIASGFSLIFVDPWRRAWDPIMWRMRGTEGEDAFHRASLRRYVALQVFAACVVAVFARPALWLLTSGNHAYDAAAPLVALIYIGFALAGVQGMLAAGYFIAGRTASYTLSVAYAAVANVMFNLFLVPLANYWGSAVAYVVAYLAFTAASGVFARRYFRPGYEWRRLIAALLIGAAFWLTAVGSSTFAVLSSLIVGAALLPVLPIVLTCAGVLARYEVEQGLVLSIDALRMAWHAVRRGGLRRVSEPG